MGHLKRWLSLAILLLSLGIAAVAMATAFEGRLTTVPGTSTFVVACQTLEASTVVNVQFKLKNTGANPLTDCKIETWVGPNSTDWVTYDANWDDCKALAAGQSATWEIAGSSHEKLRLQVKASSATQVYCKPNGTGKDG